MLPCRHSLTAVDIPNDVLDRILHFLSAKDHARSQAVCKAWAARPWSSISLASKADWWDKAQSQWFCSVAGRSSFTLQSVQLHFQDVDSWSWEGANPISAYMIANSVGQDLYKITLHCSGFHARYCVSYAIQDCQISQLFGRRHDV